MARCPVARSLPTRNRDESGDGAVAGKGLREWLDVTLERGRGRGVVRGLGAGREDRRRGGCRGSGLEEPGDMERRDAGAGKGARPRVRRSAFTSPRPAR